ncbi:MAG: sugar isomerase domain-containing protein [Lentisphaeria bacterium]
MNHIMEEYNKQVQKILQDLQTEKEKLECAAEKIADAYETKHTIYAFGCTHSGILTEDVFYRAGAPAFWRPLFGPGMSIATTPGLLTSAVEHSEEIGCAIIQCSQMTKGDVLVILSTSGKNGAPVAVADCALQRGADVIILSSKNYQNQRGNHSKYANVWALEDRALLINNHVPCGDTSLNIGSYQMGPLSTIAGSFLMHTISAMTIEKIIAKGLTPPVFQSSNTPGGLTHNESMMKNKTLRNNFMLP